MFEIGTSLREARVRRGIDFVEAESATKIRGKYLRALEDEQFDILPSQTYVKGFLRSYAEYLGLDGQLYVDEYNSRFAAGTEDHRVRRYAVRPQRRRRRIETNVVLVALAAIAIVTIIVISAWKSAGGNEPVPEVRRPAAKAKPKPVPPLLWMRALRGSSLVQAHNGSAAGKLRFEGTVAKGDAPLQLRGKRLWLNIASPENLRIRVRGKLVHVPGGHPRVILVTPTGWRPA